VTRFRVGDRVAAFHQMGTEYGAYAEYAVAPAWTSVKVPEKMGWEEGATLPLVMGTAGVSLFRRLGLEKPWEEEGRRRENEGRVLLVYGASGALGGYVVKLAKLAGVGVVIAVGGGSAAYVKGLLREEDVFVDHRVGMEGVVEEVRRVVAERRLEVRYAIDCVSEGGSWVGVSRMMDGGRLSVVSGRNGYQESGVKEGVEIVYTYVGSLHTGKYLAGMPKQPAEEEAAGDVEFAREFFKWVEVMLAEGKLEGHPYQVVPGGLEAVVDGLNMLKAGEAKGRKFVYRIAA
jgi:NADPH:quinone reductase